jgi:hypothetical protein
MNQNEPKSPAARRGSYVSRALAALLLGALAYWLTRNKASTQLFAEVGAGWLRLVLPIAWAGAGVISGLELKALRAIFAAPVFTGLAAWVLASLIPFLGLEYAERYRVLVPVLLWGGTLAIALGPLIAGVMWLRDQQPSEPE